MRRVHDLVALVDECTDLDPNLAGLADDAEILTPYRTAFRYPGDASEPIPGEAAEALECAGRILDKVTAALATG